MPSAIAALPTDKVGRPVPWFLQWFDGAPDFRVADTRKFDVATAEGLCWTCGGECWRDETIGFLVGPMCAVNRVSSEPPSHVDCAVYAARVCPFLTTPGMVRRERGLPANYEDPAGIMITRNPGVALVWVTDTYRTEDVGNGILYTMGEPVDALWFARGRPATRGEVLTSLYTGVPELEKYARAEGPDALADLGRRLSAMADLIPAKRTCTR